MTDKEKIEEILGCNKNCKYKSENCHSVCVFYGNVIEMAKYKDEQINLLLDAIDYIYLQTDGTYGDLALPVIDKINYLKSLKTTKS